MSVEAYRRFAWPTELQTLLLKAALGGPDVAGDAGRRWLPRIDVELLDPNSNLILPLLYANRDAWGGGEPALMTKLKGTHRYTWSKNQNLFHHAARAIDELDGAGIPITLLKGAALAVGYYRDIGARQMKDIDLMVPFERARDAIRVLSGAGWTPNGSHPERLVPVRHACHFIDAAGHRLDLHWHLLMECCGADADTAFWRHAVETRLHGRSVLVLDPTDQFFHTCAYGLSTYFMPPLRWAADAWMILAAKGEEIDWDRLAGHAERHRFVLTVQETLAYLRNVLDAPIPPGADEQINGLVATPSEEREYKTSLRFQKRLGMLPRFWFMQKRLVADGMPDTARIGFLRYLQHAFGLEHPWQVPGFIAATGAHRLKVVAGT